MIDSYFIGYMIGETIVDLVLVSTGSVSAITGIIAIRAIAKTHKLVDKSIDGISENLFNCLEFID